MEEIFEIRSCVEILANDIKIYTICNLTRNIINCTEKWNSDLLQQSRG